MHSNFVTGGAVQLIKILVMWSPRGRTSLLWLIILIAIISTTIAAKYPKSAHNTSLNAYILFNRKCIFLVLCPNLHIVIGIQ